MVLTGDGEVFNDDPRAQLIKKEKREQGAVTWAVYWYYLKAFNEFLLVLVLAVLVGRYAAKAYGDYQLTFWTDAGSKWISLNHTVGNINKKDFNLENRIATNIRTRKSICCR